MTALETNTYNASIRIIAARARRLQPKPFVYFGQTEVLRHLAAVDTEYLPGDEGGLV
jgi:hypothetical protein